MKRRLLRRLLYVTLGFLSVWMIAVQAGCMAMRSSDRQWAEKLIRKGQDRKAQFLDVPSPAGRTVHAVAMNLAEPLPLVVMIHGSPGSADAYLDYLADSLLSLHIRMIAIDRPGFGYTAFGRPETSLASQAQDIKAVLDQAAPGQPVILLGHSLGGPLIARFAMDFPALVRGLVIVAGSVDPTLEPHPWWESVVDNPPVRWIIPKSLWTSNREIRYLEAELRKMLPFWQDIECPVRVIHAQNDRLVPVQNVDFIRRMLTRCPDLQVKLLPDGDHFILWSRRDAVREAVLDLAGKN